MATTDSEMKRSGIELSEVFSDSQLVRLQRTLEESMRSPYRRLLTSGVEIMLRKRGQVQTLLGHEKIDTTLMYAMVNQTNVKIAHKKFLG